MSDAGHPPNRSPGQGAPPPGAPRSNRDAPPLTEVLEAAGSGAQEGLPPTALTPPPPRAMDEHEATALSSNQEPFDAASPTPLETGPSASEQGTLETAPFPSEQGTLEAAPVPSEQGTLEAAPVPSGQELLEAAPVPARPTAAPLTAKATPASLPAPPTAAPLTAKSTAAPLTA